MKKSKKTKMAENKKLMNLRKVMKIKMNKQKNEVNKETIGRWRSFEELKRERAEAANYQREEKVVKAEAEFSEEVEEDGDQSILKFESNEYNSLHVKAED